LDEASEGESDHEEVEEHFSEEEEAESDSDFDTPKKRRTLQEKNDKPEEEIEKSAGRSKSIVRGKNNFKWSKNAESRGRRLIRTYIPTVKDEAKNVKTPFEAWSLLFPNKMLEIIVLHTNEEIDRKYCVEPRVSYQTHVNLD